MSGFKALNLESDDESDIEIDDTKELQIEDALKLYQTALKYHAEGPDSFEKAAEAYEELFRSEIFQYPESQTELRRIELFGPLPETEDLWEDGAQAGTAVAGASLDSGPSTLPQILHLSHKNYAQFRLGYLESRLQYLQYSLGQILKEAGHALDHFVEALDKDDSDLDLWRRTAAVGGILDSKRVARFCLEAVFDGDEESLGTVLSLPGLNEGLAAEQLRTVIQQIEDELSLLQTFPAIGKRRFLSKFLKQRLNTYEGVGERQKLLKGQEAPASPPSPSRIVLRAPRTWAEFGSALLERQHEEQNGARPLAAGASIFFDLSSIPPLTANGHKEHTPAPSDSAQAIEVPLRSPIGEATVAQQFPGLDNGQPTTQPQIGSASDVGQRPMDVAGEVDMDAEEPATISLPTRKRSVEAAGLGDGAEEGRTKSKRTRTRESGIGEDSRQTLEDANRRWEQDQKLGEMQAADDWMFETVGNLFEKVGIIGFEAGKNVRQELQSADSDSENAMNGEQAERDALHIAKLDLQAFLSGFSIKLAQILTASGDQLDAAQNSGGPGFSGGVASTANTKTLAKKVEPMPADGLYEMLAGIDGDWPLLEDVVRRWIERLLQPSSSESRTCANSYSEYQWSEDLKTMVVRVLVNFDECLIKGAMLDLEELKRCQPQSGRDDSLAIMVQTIFELHLDVYCLIKQPNSGVDLGTIASQKDRLARWSELAREAMKWRTESSNDTYDQEDELNLRFMWATTFLIGALDGVTQDHVIETMQDLREAFVAANEPTIQLQNNAIMPELSVAALDREISRLTTKDFFLKVTNQDVSDPVAVIESLEPLLTAMPASSEDVTTVEEDSMPFSPSLSPELVRFLQSSDGSIRLMLWLRLRDAYLAIDYKPMVVSCYFKILRILLNELTTTLSDDPSQGNRQSAIVWTLRQVRILAKQLLDLVSSSEIAFECIDEEGLKDAVTCLGQVLQLTQVFNIVEDSIRVEQIEALKAPNAGDNTSFAATIKVVHEMQVHIWIVLYRLFVESIVQFSDLFQTPAEDRFDFLRTVHRNLGLRHMCGESNRAFVQLLKNEFFQMTHVDGYDSEQSQVLYDLYGINCFLNPSYELIEHHCTRDAFIDRGVAIQAVDLLIQQASKLPMKELIKHTLKDTIDKVHGSAPRKKPTDAILWNREIYRTFLRSPINPLDLYKCLKGEGNQLGVTPVPKEDAVLAAKGWYFLMGHIALAKFRSVKRTGPTPTEDVDIAIAFFNQDLEYSGDNWETWFRLAQAYDTKIEESVVWSAEKMNNSMSDIVQLQRAAIHCYTMATALAYRSADLRLETSEKMTELLTEFGMRVYASSREPLGMKPFELEDADKFLSYRQGVAKGKPFQPLRPFTAWKFAKALFQRALDGKPQSWHLHYMLGKCLWKMHMGTNLGQRDKRPSAQQVLESLVHAVEHVPDWNKKDSREKREPVLEPQYKLVSVVHKLIMKGHITLQEAKDALSNTPYARATTPPSEHSEWVPHILAVLKNLRAADKSNWHHRMIARTATIVYEEADSHAGDGGTNDLGAMAAKHELTQQMFTKTMVLQVWRPESERAGRHFVYTARYTRFFVRILEQLRDRANLEMLARRVRRRPHDLFEHALVWQDICTAYLRLLRAHATLPEGLETSTFSNIAHEDFLARKEPLEKWTQSQDTGKSAALDVLREVQELKKINQSLMKPGPIDDLIGDSYAYLFNTTGKQLWDEERRIKQEEEARRPPPQPPATSPSRNPMMSLTHLMNVDGASDPSSTVTAPPVQQAPTPAQPEPSARRKIGVGRREIRTTAESCFQKSKSSAPASTGHEITHKGPLPRVQVVIDNSRVERPGDMSVDTSAPGSVHDSADDESELSELEEEGEAEEDGKPRLMFPGLVSEGQSRQGSEGSEDAEDGGGEDEGEGEKEEEGGGVKVDGDDLEAEDTEDRDGDRDEKMEE